MVPWNIVAFFLFRAFPAELLQAHFVDFCFAIQLVPHAQYLTRSPAPRTHFSICCCFVASEASGYSVLVDVGGYNMGVRTSTRPNRHITPSALGARYHIVYFP